MEVDAVVLDMDGLMLDTESLYKTAWQAASLQCGFLLDDGFYFTLVGKTNAAGEIALLQRFGPSFPMILFRDLWTQLWRDGVAASGIPLKPGLTELLDYLAAHGIPVAIATSSDQEYAAFSLAAAKLDTARFAHIVTGDQVKNGKPAPDIYLEAARRLGASGAYLNAARPLGASSARIVAVEDSDAGILAAAGAGMLAVMVPDLKPPSAAARHSAFRILESLHDVISLLRA